MSRKGVHFEMGSPHIWGGVNYAWPNSSKGYREIFKEKKGELIEPLLINFREYAEEFGVTGIRGAIPYMQNGQKGLTLHMGMGGRRIEIWDMMGTYFISGHKLDAYNENAAAFNIGSDVLEYLDSGIKAPRINANGEDYTLNYPLPDGKRLIEHPDFDSKLLRRLYENFNLDTNLEYESNNESQTIRHPNGVIEIKDGVCVGRDFKGWEMPKASSVISTIMNFSSGYF